MLELLDRDTGRAVEQLPPSGSTPPCGRREPGIFPRGTGSRRSARRAGQARRGSGRDRPPRELAEQHEHPWGRVTAFAAPRSWRSPRRYDERAAAALDQAAEDVCRLGLAPDHARTLLSLGRAQRRFRKWGAARETLESTAAAFHELGSPGWADLARSELARVGARRPTPAGGLTSTEGRVAELAAQGLSNKEIARTMVVSVKTVEFHLSNTYAKLGIRSRGELQRGWGARAV